MYEHVICGYHDANERNWWCGPDQSDDRLTCVCQLPCVWCAEGQHDRCRRQHERQRAEAVRAGQTDPYADATPRKPWRPLGYGAETSLRAPASWWPVSRKRTLYVAVWLADRVCRYLSGCAVCQPPQPAAAPEPDAWAHGLLFDLEAS
ncbi:hypothetical protein ACFY1J_31105 [Streptomyces sp. NPDC001406]|uniref:hypothetical protein n=1 Tax=Streptomyces sp. NPDC001406 TaxID=3364572 RepID=UPI0036805419